MFKIKNFNRILYKNFLGKRKEAVAHVYIFLGKGRLIINRNRGITYFQKNSNFLKNIYNPLKVLGIEKKLDILVFVKGGGIAAQSEAIELGVAKYLLLANNNNRISLKLNHLLTRDSRVKERKKYGLKKARKAPQYSKR
uniref:Ribosomal protein S9 n=1 Tax=Nitzschia sp. PL1-4 TaxID=2083272 RepID=A0A2Z5ZB14_9STRA|nr:ribosomal protein S9 [Nitzschia sp. PL1-4]